MSSAGFVARSLAELAVLGIVLAERARCGLVKDRDAERPEPVVERGRVVRDDDKVRLVGHNGLEVRVEPVEFGYRGARRVVRVLIDCPHLPAGTDRVEHLGRHRRQRDDGGWPRLHGHGPVCARTVTGKSSARARVVEAW